MSEKYHPGKIEPKWQSVWRESGGFPAENFSAKPKFYALVEFPYPSGAGLHVGHVRGYTAMDILARKRRMQGMNVLYPIGWDAFGLPTENYAVKTGIHPAQVTRENTDTFRRQLQALGFSFDWSREINTTDPEYYKWTQWIFLKFFEKGLAYKAKTTINWCPSCKIGLANEEVVGGRCERCGTPVESREKEQWLLKITAYADKLLDGLATVDWAPHIRDQQINWIGKSEGAEIEFSIKNQELKIRVFTTRADTLFGATYLVLAPEHELLKSQELKIKNQAEVQEYVKATIKKTDEERTASKEKTGVKLEGVTAINPANQEEIPIFVADYVLSGYGTGAIMAVPAHDGRDYEFARAFSVPIIPVIRPYEAGYLVIERSLPKDALAHMKKMWRTVSEKEDKEWGAFYRVTIPAKEEKEFIDFLKDNLFETSPDGGGWYADSVGTTNVAVFKGVSFDLWTEEGAEGFRAHGKKIGIPTAQLKISAAPYCGTGTLVSSGMFSDLLSEKAKEEILEEIKGVQKSQYHLRDWVFSRQRYWGEPIPMIFCEKCGWQPVREADLPVKLPDIKEFQPRDDGESPLASVADWVKTSCPQCGGPARRETDVMPNWAGSSWYFLRYTDPQNDEVLADPQKLQYWLPVNWYNGGMEHTTLHLLYSRFWNQFLYDIGVVPVSEPYTKRTSHGMVLGEGGIKMSKSKGNVINPDDVVKSHGADTLRLYEMFMGPFDQAIPWDQKSIEGVYRFLNRVWTVATTIDPDTTNIELERIADKTVKKVGEDIEVMAYNTAVSAMMILVNECQAAGKIPEKIWRKLLLILAPFAPHITEELWSRLNGAGAGSIHKESWPVFDPDLVKDSKVTIAVQVNGKVRGDISISAEATEAEARTAALANEKVAQFMAGQNPRKIIYVPGRIINILV